MLASAEQIQHVGLSEKGAELAEYLKLLANQDGKTSRKDTLVNGVGIDRHMDGQLAYQIDQLQETDRQSMERSARQSRRQRFGKYSLRPVPKKEPNGQVHRYSQTEVRRFAMLQEIKAQKIPPVVKDIPKRLIVFDAMLNYEDKVKPFLKSIGNDTPRQINTTGLSLYLMQKIAPELKLNPVSYTQPNISSLMTQIVRVLEYAGLIKKSIADTKGKAYDYTWTIDLKMHQITKEQLEWAFNKIWHDPEFKKALRQSETFKKPITAVDNMDKDTKKVLESVLDENASLKQENEGLHAELDALRNGGSRPAEHGSGAITDNPLHDNLDDNFGNREQTQTPAPRLSAPREQKPELTQKSIGPLIEAPDPFKTLEQVKDRLTRGSTIKIEITL